MDENLKCQHSKCEPEAMLWTNHFNENSNGEHVRHCFFGMSKLFWNEQVIVTAFLEFQLFELSKKNSLKIISNL